MHNALKLFNIINTLCIPELNIDGEIQKASNSTFGYCSGEGKNCPILLIHY